MTCRRVGLPGGGVMIVCSRGQQQRLCQYPLQGSKRGLQCGRPLGRGEGVRAPELGPDALVCSAHARRLGLQS
jgi:hypothetical protein